MSAAKRAWIIALLGSFVVYLVPVATPHGMWLLGEMLVVDLARLARGEQAAWAATNMGAALALQLALLGLVRWVLARGGRRWLAVAAAVPLVLFTAQALYLVVIPAHFLIEQQTAEERGDWPVACTVTGARLLDVRAGVQLELAAAREAWIEREPGGAYEVLSMPGCRAAASGLDRGLANTLVHVSPGAAALYRSRDAASGSQSYWLSTGPGSPPKALTAPAGEWWSPVLARHADAIAWLESERSGEGRISHRLVMRAMDGGDDRPTTLSGEIWSHPRVLSLDTHAGEIVLATGFSRIVVVGLDGHIKSGPLEVAGFDDLQASFRRHGDGWVVWDGYREQGRYRVQWSLSLGQGRHEIPKGRGINDVAVDPWGRFIAISTTSTLSIGAIRDEFYVLRAHDGAEVYRRYLDRHTRTALAFLGPHFLAFTRHDLGSDARASRVEVLRVPGPVAAARVDEWVVALRARVAPLPALFVKLDGEGLGEEDCGAFGTALGVEVPAAPDEIGADLARPLHAALGEAQHQCERWDPAPFVIALLDVERLVGDLHEHIVYEYGLELLPPGSSLQPRPGGSTIGPLETPDGGVRVKRTRTP